MKHLVISRKLRTEFSCQTDIERRKHHDMGWTVYLYAKSMNVKVQKKSFSGLKKARLFKAILCIFPDGYIYEVSPFNTAVINDASISRRISNSDPRFAQCFRPGYSFIVDRGFRDVVNEFNEKVFNVYVPASASGRNQLTWEDAKKNWLITKLYWAVEVVNG